MPRVMHCAEPPIYPGLFPQQQEPHLYNKREGGPSARRAVLAQELVWEDEGFVKEK